MVTWIGRRRRWSDEDKAQVVAERLDPGMTGRNLEQNYRCKDVAAEKSRTGVPLCCLLAQTGTIICANRYDNLKVSLFHFASSQPDTKANVN
jgi:hypothetical protein